MLTVNRCDAKLCFEPRSKKGILPFFSQVHSQLISYPSNGHSGRGVHNIHNKEQQVEQLVSLGLHSSWVGKGVQNMEGVHQHLPRPQALPQQRQLRELRATVEKKIDNIRVFSLISLKSLNS